ncbi:MAG: GNAT family N-acetyltransferase [Burkholderiaceae bacterium]|jgi:RimJ/RimL family protein N-acetyltransferase
MTAAYELGSPFTDVALAAERVTLRMLRLEDAPAVFAIFSDPEVVRYWSRPALTDPKQALELIELIQSGYREGSFLQLGVQRNLDRALIGTCTLFHIDGSNLRAELGYALGRAYWGQGLMHEALVVLVDYAFFNLGLRRLEADIDPRNAASEKSLLRLGFVCEGLMRERWFVNGEASDTGFYGLLKSQWGADPKIR